MPAMNAKFLVLASIASLLTVTGCASRKPATEPTVISNGNTGESQANGVNTTTSDPYANIDQRGGSATGVTDSNRAFLANRVVHFDYDSSDISNQDYQTLQAHAQYLMANANARIALVGHTDERGTREYNMALGERRAKSVAAFLVSNGVNQNQLETVSYGKEQPVNLGHDETAWGENRRVAINYEAVPPLLSPQR
jgi:peptidoglycan-associated lipoprotein